MKRRATSLRLAAAATASMLVLTACGGGDSDDDSSNDGNGGGDEISAADEDFTNEACADGATSADTFKVSGVLPLTGNLAFLGPPEIAGVGLAVNDINAAGGVGGADACSEILDSGDATDASVGNNAAQSVISGQSSVAIGAAASSVTFNIIDAITDAGIVQISPANTAVSLSGYSPFYFRTAPPDEIQGSALGNQILNDGNQKVAFLVFNDAYGTGLRDAVQATIEEGGGEVTYGGQGDNQEFPPAQTTFSAEVTAALATNPDAIVVLSFDETKAIVPELANQGWDMSKIYMTDGNTSNYGEEFAEGTLAGAQGTIPGADASDEFKGRLLGWYDAAENTELTDYSYAAESYDAVILAALAAVKGGDTTPATIQENLPAVSGSTEGEECSTYADCVELLDGGSEIAYRGPSGIGPFDEDNDPTSAFVGIYKYGEDNNYSLETTVEGFKE